MKRIVVTGMGALSPLGNSLPEITDSLRNTRSGIIANANYLETGLKCNVSGSVDVNLAELIDRKMRRFMSVASAYAFLATRDAIADANLTPEQVGSDRTATIIGVGGNGISDQHEVVQIHQDKGAKRVGPYYVTRIMANSPSAIVSTYFRARGPSFTVSSACATSAHAIGLASEQIQLGNVDIVLAGGCEEEYSYTSLLFDSMGALSSKYNDDPQRASRPFDRDRDGFVPAGGSGTVIVEEMEHALKRGARIYAEITGYCATSDGADMVSPSGEGAARCMKQALRNCETPDYINAHATSTPTGDLVELQSIRDVLGSDIPPISSTKALMGHALGAASALEFIFSLLMMEGRFIVPCVNLQNPDGIAADYPLPIDLIEDVDIKSVMSNSFGFGGTNACLVAARLS